MLKRLVVQIKTGRRTIIKSARDKNYIVSKLQRKRWVLRLFLKIAEK